MVALALLVLLPTAVAARGAIWAPDPTPLPERCASSRFGGLQRAGAQVCVGSGNERGSPGSAPPRPATTAPFAPSASSRLSPGAGEGARCDVASHAPGGGVSPTVLAQRLVQTYFDPVATRTWAFGSLRTTDQHGTP